MANVNAPFGMRPVRHKSGAPYTGAYREYHIGTGESGAVFIGDPVVMNGTSNATEVMGRPIGTLPGAVLHTAGANPITGVVIGFATDDRSDLTYRPGSTERIAFVADDPDLIFQVRDNGAAQPLVTWLSSNGNLASGSGSTAYGTSAYVLAGATTPTNTAGAALRLVSLASIPGNEMDEYAVWEVVINNHTGTAGIVGVGISA